MPRGSFVAQTSSSASNSSVSLDIEDDNAMVHYVGIERTSKNPVKRALLKNFTPRGLLDKLLRKTLKRNTWIRLHHDICHILAPDVSLRFF
ncbi:hypothetical protein C8Q74DRAFT_1239782 [Fomes fomentarius]|nr:hypothetical protein C8Q74DRAFT_1239782 [Fomes fomentarius]